MLNCFGFKYLKGKIENIYINICLFTKIRKNTYEIGDQLLTTHTYKWYSSHIHKVDLFKRSKVHNYLKIL